MLNTVQSVPSGKSALGGKNSYKKLALTIFTFLIVHCTLIIDNCTAQWQTDMRLTNDSSGGYTSLNNAWCIASSGNVLHVVWYDFRDGSPEIYYKRSTDLGLSWGTDIRLTNNSANSRYPSVAVSGSVVHVVWQDDRDGNYEIYYKLSTDGGSTWGADIRMTNASNNSWYPSVSVSGQAVHVVWDDMRDGNDEIYYKCSADGGTSWGGETRLTNNSASSLVPSVSVSGQAVHVVWDDTRNGSSNNEIYYKSSTDGGNAWGEDIRLTNNPAYSTRSSVSVSGQVVHVLWHDSRDGDWQIYYKRSTDGGVSWGADTRLTNTFANASFPSVSVSGSSVHVVWNDNRDGNYSEIYYKRSTDGGVSWGEDTRLTNDPLNSLYPSMAVSGSVMHVLWHDFRDGNFEIYYKRNPTGNIVGIKNTDLEIPKKFSLGQNYPNPFNPNTVISYSVGIPSGQLVVNSFTTLKVYDVLGNEVATLVDEEQIPGIYEVQWNGSNFSSGVYYYTLSTHDVSRSSIESFKETKRMMLIK